MKSSPTNRIAELPLIYIDRNNLDNPSAYFDRLVSVSRNHAISELEEIIETYRDGYVLPNDHDAFESFVTAAEIKLADLNKR